MNNDYNLINTYYGAQVWESWGISVYFKKNNINSNIIITNKNPIINQDKVKLAKVIYHQNNSIKDKFIEIDLIDIFILDFKKIYKNGFNNLGLKVNDR